MPRSGPRKLHKYSDECKRTAVRLSQQPGTQIKTVATALEIHPFMLSKWRKDVRKGLVRGRAPQAPPPGPAREIAQLQALERRYAELQEEEEEHELLKQSHSVLFRSKGETFACSDAHCTQFSVTWLCERFAVTPGGFYAWRQRGVSAHAKQDRVRVFFFMSTQARSLGWYRSVVSAVARGVR